MQTTLFLPTDVAREIAYAARFRPGSYQAAVLLGATTEDGRTDVRAYTDLSTLDGPFIFLRDMLSDWDSVGRRAKRLAPELDVVGWVSIWPGREAELGTVESMVHRTFFNLPHHVSLCVDPDSERLVAYRTSAGGEPVPVPIQSAEEGLESPMTELPRPLPETPEPDSGEAPQPQE